MVRPLPTPAFLYASTPRALVTGPAEDDRASLGIRAAERLGSKGRAVPELRAYFGNTLS